MNVPISKVKLILINKSDETCLLVKNSLNERYTLPEATVRFGEGIIDCILRILHKKLNFPDIEENLFFDVILDQDLSKYNSIDNNKRDLCERIRRTQSDSLEVSPSELGSRGIAARPKSSLREDLCEQASRQVNELEYNDSLLKNNFKKFNKKSFFDFFSKKKSKKIKNNVSLYGIFEHYETDKTRTKSINDLFNENYFLDTETSTPQDFHTINYLIKIELNDSVIYSNSNQNDTDIQSSVNEEYKYIRYNTISEIKKLLNSKFSRHILDSNLDIYFQEKRKNELSEVLDTLII